MESCVEKHGTSVTSKLCSFRTHRSDCQKQLNCWVIKTNCIRSRFSATRVSNDHFKDVLVLLILLICVTIGALEQILTAHFKTFTMDNFGRTFNISSSSSSLLICSTLIGFSHINSPTLLLELYIWLLWTYHIKSEENVILLGIIPGIIPGPGEPRRNINQYILRPFVKEMLQYNTMVRKTNRLVFFSV